MIAGAMTYLYGFGRKKELPSESMTQSSSETGSIGEGLHRPASKLHVVTTKRNPHAYEKFTSAMQCSLLHLYACYVKAATI